uniref:Testicular acid phosphatase homolog n=1 Tax=Enterobius vermicularis TaxID=51028 RepID=A0A0N4V495_ENTVE
MLRPTDWECSLYDEVADHENKDAFKKLKKEYSDFFKFLKNVTGYEKVGFGKAASLNNLNREVRFSFDSPTLFTAAYSGVVILLIVEVKIKIIHHLPQPDWVYKRWPEHDNQTTLEIVTELKRIERVSEFDSPDKARLRGGLLLGDWVSRAVNISNGKVVQPQKMNLYSTHEGTVASLMYAFGIGDGTLIPYAACLIMEVYQTPKGGTVVKLLYKNQTDQNYLHNTIIPGCQEFCPVKKLKKLLADMIIDDDDELVEQERV